MLVYWVIFTAIIWLKNGASKAEFVTIFPSGPPSTPGLTLELGEDLTSFDLTIIPSIPRDCVVNYIITATSSDGSRNITVPASVVDGSTPVNVGGFDVCTVAYNITVAPETSEGTGMESAYVVSGM